MGMTDHYPATTTRACGCVYDDVSGLWSFCPDASRLWASYDAVMTHDYPRHWTGPGTGSRSQRLAEAALDTHWEARP
jgi:hypothetical protein